MKRFQRIWIILFLITSASGLKGQNVGGFWIREDAKQNEPFLLFIDEDQKLIQIINKNARKKYKKLKPLSYQRKPRTGRAEYQVNKSKSNTSFYWVNNLYGLTLNMNPSRRSGINSSNTKYTFKRPNQMKRGLPTDGSLNFTNYTSFPANLYYVTKKKRLLIQKIPRGSTYFQPTQKGMNWMLTVNGKKYEEFVAEGDYDVQKSIGKKSNAPIQNTIDYERVLSSSIWINKNAPRGAIQRLVIGRNFREAAGIKRSSSYVNTDPIGGIGDIQILSKNTYSVDAGILQIKFEPQGNTPYLDDIQLSVSEGRNRATFLESLGTSGQGKNIILENRLRAYANIYYIYDGNKMYFDRIAPRETYTLETLADMSWKIESGQGYNRGLSGNTQENWIQLTEDDMNTLPKPEDPLIIPEDEFEIIPHDGSFPDYKDPRGNDDFSTPNVARPTRIILGNSFNFSIEVFAINSDGKGTYYGILESGQIDHFPSFVGQTWMAKDLSGKSVSWYTVPKEKDKNFFR